MRFENHPLLNAIIASRRSRVRRREDGIIEIIEYRPPLQSAQLPIARERWWRWIALAMLSVPGQMLDAFVEGCALYAVSMNPGAFGFSIQDADRDDPLEDLIPLRSTPGHLDACGPCLATVHEPRSNLMK